MNSREPLSVGNQNVQDGGLVDNGTYQVKIKMPNMGQY